MHYDPSLRPQNQFRVAYDLSLDRWARRLHAVRVQLRARAQQRIARQEAAAAPPDPLVPVEKNTP